MNVVFVVTQTSFYDEMNPENGSTSVMEVFTNEEDAKAFVASMHVSNWVEFDIEEFRVK